MLTVWDIAEERYWKIKDLNRAGPHTRLSAQTNNILQTLTGVFNLAFNVVGTFVSGLQYNPFIFN